MKILNNNKLTTKVIFLIIGMGYFSLFSQLNISPFLRGYIVIIPVQILTIIYFAYFYWKNKE